jgi:hypothetical protein
MDWRPSADRSWKFGWPPKFQPILLADFKLQSFDWCKLPATFVSFKYSGSVHWGYFEPTQFLRFLRFLAKILPLPISPKLRGYLRFLLQISSTSLNFSNLHFYLIAFGGVCNSTVKLLIKLKSFSSYDVISNARDFFIFILISPKVPISHKVPNSLYCTSLYPLLCPGHFKNLFPILLTGKQVLKVTRA